MAAATLDTNRKEGRKEVQRQVNAVIPRRDDRPGQATSDQLGFQSWCQACSNGHQYISLDGDAAGAPPSAVDCLCGAETWGDVAAASSLDRAP
eukprot:s8580_g2.t1